MNFDKWLDTFLEEKGIDLEENFEVEDKTGAVNFMTYATPVEYIKAQPADTKKIIKNKLVMIDFKNGDVRHFLRYAGKHLADMRAEVINK